MRVVGPTGTTLLPQTSVTTTTASVDPDGNPADTCSGTSAFGALYAVTHGNIVVQYDGPGLGYEVDGIQGLNFPTFSPTVSPDAYWSFWLNNAPASVGACGQELNQGDAVVFVAQCFATGTTCTSSATAPDHFLTETAPVSRVVLAGAPVSVTIGSLDTLAGHAESSLPAGVVVTGSSLSSSVSAAPNAHRVATLAFATAGSYTIQAAAPDSVPSDPYVVCVHNTNDGGCATTVSNPGAGTSTTGSSSAGTSTVTQIGSSADVPRIADLHNGNVFSAQHAPRILRGAVALPTGATLRQVRIRLERQRGSHCFAFSGSRGSFVSAKCGAAKFFSVGSSASFSFLLPARLPAGRYVYEIQALDQTGTPTKLTSGVSHVVFRVK